jgi:hypothetical protein
MKRIVIPTLKMIKYLQFLTASEVACLVILGIFLALKMPDRITVYGQLCGALSPFLLAQIGAAFAGNQLKAYLEQRVDAIKAKKANGAESN